MGPLASVCKVTVQLGDDFRTVTQQAFLGDPRVKDFAKRLRLKFDKTLAIAIECARQFTGPTGPKVPIEILLTGGGYALPMVKELATNPSRTWKYSDASSELVDGFNDNINRVSRQLAVAIGGAVRDLPVQTASVKVSNKESRDRLPAVHFVESAK